MTAKEHMREYETIYVMRPELDDKAAKDLMLSKKAFIEKLGGKNIKVTAMGRRKLAWETQKETRGVYVHHRFLGKPGIVSEWDRSLIIDDNILIRHSVVLKHDVNPELVREEEDSLVPPVFREKREFSDRRSRSGYDRDSDDEGDFDHGGGGGRRDHDDDFVRGNDRDD